MRDKKKSFWYLIIFFGILTILTLSINKLNSSSMNEMGLSMGGMLKVHHKVGLKPGDLLKPIIEDHGMGDTAGHHPLPPIMESLAFFTTVTVFLLLPLLLGGAVLLWVLWT